jgi:aminopeptidase N
MKWDEDVFGLECDLDIYMIVAVDAFNMGAMENKGLNIFNSQYVLADPTTATDQNYMGIEGVIAHEYFHNWTGNRVTCRDWFQLTLKEGLTVFRDQEFSSDMNSRPVKRIEDVRVLRDYQFAEDAGPNVHPIRPQSYIEVNNFYTSTVYNKGAEVIRMIETLIGKEKFRKGITRYFELYDGQAVTTEDFIYAMHLASGVDFSHFQKWYSQAGTPLCDVDADYDENLKEYRLRFKQTAPKILKEQKCEPFLFPIKTGFIGTEGQALSLKLKGDQKAREEHTLILSEASQEFVFEGVKHKPIPSLLRDFSAPISLVYDYSEEDLSLLMSKDSNSFNRYEAGQRLARRTLNQMIAQCQKGKPFEIASSFTDAFGCLLEKADEDFALTAESMILPSLNSLVAEMPICDFDAAYAAKEFLLKSLAVKYQECLLKIYYECQETGEYRVDFASVGRRSLKNRVLEYLSYLEGEDVITLIAQQLEKATNMTDEIAAFSTLVQIDCPQREMAIETFYQKWYHEPLVMNKWLSVQAFSKRPDVLAQVKNLEKHKIFDINNPNKVRSLIGCFAGNLVRFHDQSGEGYQYLADKIIEINRFNPSIAARLSTSFKLFSKMNKSLKAKMETQLERIMVTDGLSRDVYEMVYNTLTSNKKNETSA